LQKLNISDTIPVDCGGFLANIKKNSKYFGGGLVKFVRSLIKTFGDSVFRRFIIKISPQKFLERA